MAAVASRTSNNSPHTNSSRMSSPKDARKKNNIKSDEPPRRDSNVQSSDDARSSSPSRLESSNAVQPPEAAPADSNPAGPDGAAATSNAQPLGPPPRPGTSDAPDYFSQVHNQTVPNAYRGEPNPFEVEFANTSGETPGKNLLPPVASLTSPQALLPAGTPGWSSLRSGPLSPAMLAGPTGNNDYFGDAPFNRGFPTPNESSLRTGLTPGGGGSMFPAPSPNTQAIFNSLQPSGGAATPSTLDFMRTVNRASAAAQSNNFGGPTSQPADSNVQSSMDQKFQQAQPQSSSDPFGHPDTDAANGLYMLAQSNGMRNQYPVQSQALQTGMGPMANVGTQPQETSPLSRTANRSSLGTASGDNAELSDSDHSDEQSKPATRSRGKKGSTSNNRRKADETPAKGPASKRQKNNSSKVADMSMSMSDDETSPRAEDGKDTRKMTDEEKRRNFLERNRVAALKCRQRKKQWLANLQAKVELFSTENDALSQTVSQLREEIVNLRSLLLAHRDCPVSVQQGLGGAQMNAFIEGGHHNPYGMAAQPNGMPQGIPMQMPQGGPTGQLQRR